MLFLAVMLRAIPNDSWPDPAWRKIKVGMTVVEVERILGPTGGTRGGYYPLTLEYDSEDRLSSSRYERLEVSFAYDPNSGTTKVAHIEILDFGPDRRTLWERLHDEYRYQKSKLGL
jgi:hypothetical protein